MTLEAETGLVPSMVLTEKAQPPRYGVTFAAELAFEDVCLDYGRVQTLKGISLTVKPGEILCLLGPSGSGKTSLLRVAAGLERQTQGRVLMNGKEIAGDKTFVLPEKRSVGLMFQDFALFPHMTVLDNVRFGLAGIKSAESRREAEAAIARVGLTHHLNSYPDVLSGGEQQRVALARALAPRPAVILMDEPFSGLDTRLKDQVRAETLAILRETRATTVVVTHDAEEAMRMGDRIALLNEGRIAQAGTAWDIYHAPADLFIASFFSELNVYETVAEAGQVTGPLASCDAAQFSDGTRVDMAIRTAGIDVSPADAGGPGVAGRILGRRFIGNTEILDMAVAGSDANVRARIRAGELPANVRDVMLNVRQGDILLFESRAQSA